MVALAAGVLLVLVADQGIKLLLRRQLGARLIPLGPLGTVQIIDSRMWLTAMGVRPNLAVVWSAWIFGAVALGVISVVAPRASWPAGLLLGGALSNGIETSVRGSVSDYVCLRFWPAFNLADVAITLGAAGVLFGVFIR